MNVCTGVWFSRKLYRLCKVRQLIKFLTFRSVHLHPSQCARPSFSIFRGSGSETRCWTSLASQTHFRKRGKGLVNCVYKPCPAALYSAVQSSCSILSHDTLHHCLSSNSSLENSEREQGHLSRYYSNRKNTSRIVFRERAYSATGNSRVHYLKSGYVIQLIAFRWDKACIRSSPDPSLSCGSGSGLRDYGTPKADKL